MSKGVLSSLKSLKLPTHVWKRQENEPEDSNQRKKKKTKGIRKFIPHIPNMGNWTSALPARHTHYIENEEENALKIMAKLNELREEKLHCDVTFGDNGEKAAHKIVLSFNQKLLDLAATTGETIAVEIDNGSFMADTNDEKVAEPEADTTATDNDVVVDDSTANAEIAKEETQTEVTSEDSQNDETKTDDVGLVSHLQSSDGETKEDEEIATTQEKESTEVVTEESAPATSSSDDVIPAPLCAELVTTMETPESVDDKKEKTEEEEVKEKEEEVAVPESMTDPFDVIVNFLYTSHIDITKRNVSALRILALECELSDIVTACDEFDKVLRTETVKFESNKEKDDTAAQFRYRYSDPSLPSKMMKHFNDLRHHKKFVDVIVTSPSKKIRLDCHSLVLSSGSNFFEPILSLGGNAECEFEVTEVKEGVLEALVSFIYTGKVGVNNHNVSKLMQGSDRMQLSEIIEGCAEYLETTTNAHNCVQHRSIAIDYKCNKLKETAMSCIAEHFSQVSRSTDFLLLSVGGLIEVMTSNDLHLDAPLCEGEMSVFDAIRRWISHDEENRKTHVDEVMSVVRFPLMNQQKLIDHVISDLLVMESDALCGLVTRVISQKPFHAFDEPVYMRGNEYIITLGGSSPVSDITSEERGYTAVAYNQHVTVYDATHDRFHELTTLPETRALHCAVACDQYVFVVGGFDSYSCIVNNVHCFDLASGMWEDMPHLKIKRACFSLHVVSGFLYAVGGLTPNGYTSSVERLDRSRKTWELAAALPSTRYRHAGCVYKGEVLVTGGCEKLDSVLSYNPDVNEWKKCKPMNVGRDSHVMAVANDKAFVIGGDGINFSMEYYDGTNWSLINTEMSCSVKKLYLPGVAVLNDTIYMLGGWKAESDAIGHVRYYDAVNGNFVESSETLPIPLGSASSCTVRFPKNYWKRKFH